MLKICAPLETIFKCALRTGVFLNGKKETLFPFQKIQANIKNYRPVFLLPICVNIFEGLIFNKIFNPTSKNQSDFKLGDSCIHQLLSITHKIFTSFDNGLEIRSVF